ncbi:MAG: hypothetical protein IKH75_06255 [Ruminococcus sp.]|nr:hypothetical protein [Ruminococcus sp.]
MKKAFISFFSILLALNMCPLEKVNANTLDIYQCEEDISEELIIEDETVMVYNDNPSDINTNMYSEPLEICSDECEYDITVDSSSQQLRVALPAGTYYSESRAGAFIRIDSTTSSTTSCMVYNVYSTDTNSYICGYGTYGYNLYSNFDFYISPWFIYGVSGSTSYSTNIIPACYSGGKIGIANGYGGYEYYSM